MANDLPVEDIRIHVKNVVNNKWQQEWQNYSPDNKLREIKETVRPWKSSSQNKRHEEVILTRLCIGHTNITHKFLMSTPHEPLPYCNNCQVPLTVRHILLECRKYTLFRNILFKTQTLVGILSENPDFCAFNIFRFLKIYNLLDKI